MTDNKHDHNKTDSKNPLSKAEIDLWKEMTKDVSRFEGREYSDVSDDFDPPKQKDKKLLASAHSQQDRKVESVSSVPKGRDLDRNTEKRLKKGEIPIEGKLDLHGLNQGQARDQLLKFIIASQAAGKRCVLVVTGKGNTGRTSEDWLSREPGVLKRKVPDWLNEAQLASIVLKALPAQPRHGGDGALYVYLRRKR